jgi:hypothetical protein
MRPIHPFHVAAINVRHGWVGRGSGERVSNSLHPTSQGERGEFIMSTIQEETTRSIRKDTALESDPTKIDRNAPAGTPASLGAESVRDGRPSTDDSVVEAMDEEAPPFAGN